MIAQIDPVSSLTELYSAFLEALRDSGFRGEIAWDYASRVVYATDNSIYQRIPQGTVFPLDVADVECLARLVEDARFRNVILSPRGGGTGTNGQSLTDGLIVDTSRHLNSILEINVEERWARVQSGVVKDQLNAALKPYGLFFAPELSTSNRATIGGMISTDASGQGSCTYGKTRDHVLELESVLLGGQRLFSKAVNDSELIELRGRDDRVGEVYRCASEIADSQADLIAERFPDLNRCLTGYDLAHLREPEGRFNLNSVLCGAEGSLGFLVEAKLNLLPVPQHTILVNVRYASFMDALRDARALMALSPLSIETVDSKVLLLAMQDIVWHGVAEYFPAEPESPTLGINLVEFSGDDLGALESKVEAFLEHLQSDTQVPRQGHTLAVGAAAVGRVYAMRKRAVGLLANQAGEKRPQPFVEDTAVPPQHLAEYIAEFRQVLDSFGLEYGMFGHVDAGVLHVRPLLDMKDPEHAKLIRPISDAVAALTAKYGGLLWGEHGKGLRSEYAPSYFGELYPALQKLKSAFDPYNQLNPGKIATPQGDSYSLTRLDEVPLRGDHDRQIDERVWASYGNAMHCNGNGACYNFDPDDAMCPSWKATGERIHSPKGRASLLREWLRLQGAMGVDVLASTGASRKKGLIASAMASFRALRRDQEDFSHQVYEAMAGCLACKSCAGQCPVKVDVPEFRSRFLELYHTRYRRPLKDYLIASLEYSLPLLAKFARVYNRLLLSRPVRYWLEHQGGLVDSPTLSLHGFKATQRRWSVELASPDRLSRLSPEQRMRSVILVQDAFTRYFETELFVSWLELATRLGFNVYLAPFMPNGKPLQVQGFLGAFERAAIKNSKQLKELSGFGISMVGLDPAMTLVYRQEYAKALDKAQCATIELPQEWLARVLPEQTGTGAGNRYMLLAHCTEKTNAPASVNQWCEVYARFGLKLEVLAVGCCGMAGTYGHETRNQEASRNIFELSWAQKLEAHGASGHLLADGYSCRSQVKRFTSHRLDHPLQVLLKQVRQSDAGRTVAPVFNH